MALLQHPFIKGFPEDKKWKVLMLAGAHRNWAAAELAAETSVDAASQDLKEAARWAGRAVKIAEHVQGPEGWLKKLRGFAGAHDANILKAWGKLKASEAAFVKANRLWNAGSDPDRILDPGRLLDLEAGLLREQGRFEEALGHLKKVRPVSRRLQLMSLGPPRSPFP